MERNQEVFYERKLLSIFYFLRGGYDLSSGDTFKEVLNQMRVEKEIVMGIVCLYLGATP